MHSALRVAKRAEKNDEIVQRGGGPESAREFAASSDTLGLGLVKDEVRGKSENERVKNGKERIGFCPYHTCKIMVAGEQEGKEGDGPRTRGSRSLFHRSGKG